MSAALLANVLFWSGLAIGGVVFAALLEVTGGEWAGPLRSLAEGFRRFLPVSFVAFLVLMWRGATVYGTAAALRVTIVSAAVYSTAFWFCRNSRRRRSDPAAPSPMTSAVVFLIVYAVGFSLIAVDVVMALEPHWTSTLFPAYVFTGNVYLGIAGVAVLAAWRIGVREPALTDARSRDMANLLAAVALFWFYLFWSQYLVIWYGNVTAEVGYLMVRLGDRRAVSWTVLTMCAVVPAVAFIPRAGKRAAAIRIVAPIILAGMALERWLLVAPDVPPASFIGAFATTVVFGLAFLAAVDGRWAMGDERWATGEGR